MSHPSSSFLRVPLDNDSPACQNYGYVSFIVALNSPCAEQQNQGLYPMPTCHKCKEKFPNRLIVDGKERMLNRRKFCLECSPFGRHNTADLTIGEQGTCRECGKGFIYKRSGGHRRTVCNTCSVHKNRFAVKQWAIAYKGGACAICGYNRCMGALQFHHLDADAKQFAIGGNHTRRKSVLTKELDKCILLCANCHAELHAGLVTIASVAQRFSATVL